MLRALLLALIGTAAIAVPAAHAADPVKLVRVGSFASPVELVAPPGDTRHNYVVEQGGRIRVMSGRRTLARPFLDLGGQVQAGGERGLLSMAFHPDYAKNKRFYVYFTDGEGDIRVMQFLASSATRADPASGRLIIEIAHRQFGNHNGGHLEFGRDGNLYFGTGDGGGGGDELRNAQNLGSLLGKLLRIAPLANGGYRSPSGNLRGAIYAYGLRNPWRWSFDTNGDLTIGDVGQSEIEEVDFVRNGRARGRNFGWGVFEGTKRFRGGSAPRHIRPVLQHTHANGFCGVVGGFVVRDKALRTLLGDYVYGDLCDTRLRAAHLSRGRASQRRALGLEVSGLSSFGRDARGRIYAISLSGPVYRLAAR